jgi:hypothetical protein
MFKSTDIYWVYIEKQGGNFVSKFENIDPRPNMITTQGFYELCQFIVAWIKLLE